ncbi:acetaldehyde dehydrogenase [Streptomyces sp. NRRL F-2747]|uniref:acetaldehyde dehydrogenase n=1 Tax=Streptomyces sp. NRRL F-2747 TaxID=1463843 RepID=UPI0004CABC83|nr:acetaldehyde dehydrogenase [Streptomyces sp. NRRL F-2747]
MAAEERRRVAVLGAGLIGVDLAGKIARSSKLELALVAGRSRDSLGLRQAARMGHPTTAGGISAVVESGPFEVVFDATNADSHPEHWAALRPTGTTLINLTPSGLGTVTVPGVKGLRSAAHRHLSLVSCGGQASIPMLHAIAQRCTPTYIEVVSTGASASAGPATRLNLDQYIATTAGAIRTFTGTREVKVMVNISPARPAPPFRVAMTVLAENFRPTPVRTSIAAAADAVRAYVPGFKVTSLAVDPGRIQVAVEVTPSGQHLPRHAGSVDIINAAAVLLAEQPAAAS